MHIHHIIPRHMGGTDHPDNLIELSIEKHAQAHKKLYEEHGKIEDKMAWKGLAGMINDEEIIKMRQSIGGKNVKGYKRTSENCANISAVKLGKKIGKQPKMSLAKKDNKYALGYTHKNEQCPHCNKIGSGGVMKRWHFDNCKEIKV